jgi:hypothetical protein
MFYKSFKKDFKLRFIKIKSMKEKMNQFNGWLSLILISLRIKKLLKSKVRLTPNLSPLFHLNPKLLLLMNKLNASSKFSRKLKWIQAKIKLSVNKAPKIQRKQAKNLKMKQWKINSKILEISSQFLNILTLKNKEKDRCRHGLQTAILRIHLFIN